MQNLFRAGRVRSTLMHCHEKSTTSSRGVLRKLIFANWLFPSAKGRLRGFHSDQNIQLFICRSAHLDPQYKQVSPGLPAGN
jgi:hypothetical protein